MIKKNYDYEQKFKENYELINKKYFLIIIYIKNL